MTQEVQSVNPVTPIHQDIIEEPVKPEKNYFAELASINVGSHIEKKQQFSYLSWAWAVDYLKRVHPDAIIKVREFPDVQTGQMLPYLKTETGFYVQVDVTVNGITEGEFFGVTDNKNNPIQKPTTKDINNSIQRAKVKSIAAHGLGLYIYAGEDVPLDDTNAPTQQPEPTTPAPFTQIQSDKLTQLAVDIAKLTSPANATKEILTATYKQVKAKFQVPNTMTAEMADYKIQLLSKELNNLRAQSANGQASAANPMFANTPNG